MLEICVGCAEDITVDLMKIRVSKRPPFNTARSIGNFSDYAALE